MVTSTCHSGTGEVVSGGNEFKVILGQPGLPETPSLPVMGSHGEDVSRGGHCPWCPELSRPSSALQTPQPAVPEGCLEVRPGALVKHLVRVHMLSCACQPQNRKTMSIGKPLNLSGAAYNLVVLTRTRFGRSPYQMWHLPAQELTGAWGPGAEHEGGGFLRHAQKNEVKTVSK